MKPRTIKGTAALPLPWEPVETLPIELGAIKALMQGQADARQQHLVVEWLARATGVTELEFRPDSERASAFAGGKRFVGQQFFQLAKVSLASPSTAAPTKGTRQS